MDDLRFEDMTSNVCEQVYAIERESIPQAWTLEMIKELAEDERAVARVGIMGERVISYYSFYSVCGEGYINNFAVGSEFRRQGIGFKTIIDMIDQAKKCGNTALTLEVSERNLAAIALYSKLGFAVEGRRVKFYDAKDDALIMWKRGI